MRRLVSFATVGVMAAVMLVPATATHAVSGCGGSTYAPPGVWGPESRSQMVLIGTRGTRAGYKLTVMGSAIVGAEVLGFIKGRAKWVATPPFAGTALASVPWGEVAGLPAIKVKSLSIPTGVFVSWEC